MRYTFPAIILSFLTATIDFFWLERTSLVISYGLVIPLLIIFFWLFIKKIIGEDKVEEGSWLKVAGFLIFLIILFNAPGTLYFHELYPSLQYDRFLHFSCGFVIVPLMMMWISLLFRMKGFKIPKSSTLWLTFSLVLIGLFAWEGFQFLLDKIFETKSFFDYSQPIVIDFWEDVFFGFAGTLLGLWYSSKLYGRIEGEMRG